MFSRRGNPDRRAPLREALRESIRHIQAQNAGVDPDALDRLVDAELGAARPSFWSVDRR